MSLLDRMRRRPVMTAVVILLVVLAISVPLILRNTVFRDTSGSGSSSSPSQTPTPAPGPGPGPGPGPPAPAPAPVPPAEPPANNDSGISQGTGATYALIGIGVLIFVILAVVSLFRYFRGSPEPNANEQEFQYVSQKAAPDAAPPPPPAPGKKKRRRRKVGQKAPPLGPEPPATPPQQQTKPPQPTELEKLETKARGSLAKLSTSFMEGRALNKEGIKAVRKNIGKIRGLAKKGVAGAENLAGALERELGLLDLSTDESKTGGSRWRFPWRGRAPNQSRDSVYADTQGGIRSTITS